MGPEDLARYIVSFLQRRNRGELQDAFDQMRVGDYNLLLEELAMILEHRGKPPNWVE